MKKIEIYDTTLRDGNQSEELNLSTEDKIQIARKLDELGVDFIEGGWPGSNPVDNRFFKEIRFYGFKHARIAAFGSTRHPRQQADNDPNLLGILDARAEVVTLFGKSWDLHAKEALRISLEENLDLIGDSFAFLRPHTQRLLFDAEHFFDGYKHNPEYALAALRRAHEAGADTLVLCDTNGGTLPHEIGPIVATVAQSFPGVTIGIHTHNDSETAVASALEAVRQGASHVQGTINGYGERCGNANLCSIIPILELKCADSFRCLPDGALELLTQTAHFVADVANVKPFERQPFVGRSAFAHKGGVHISAVARNPKTYEHIDPLAVGNEQRLVHSGQAGRSLIMRTAKKFGFDLDKDSPFVTGLLDELKKKESLGYEYSSAEASFELLMYRYLGREIPYFGLSEFRVLNMSQNEDNPDEKEAEATVIIKVGGIEEHTAAKGHGPVNALDQALRKALEKYYPQVKDMHLLDFKVRVLSGGPTGTASNVRVLAESGDHKSSWFTVGVSHNVIQASCQALVDSFKYKFFKDELERMGKTVTP